MNTFVSVVKRVRKLTISLILIGAICFAFISSVRAESGVGTAIKMIIDAFSFNTTKTAIDSNGCYEGSYVTDETRKPPVPICISEDGKVKDNPGPPPAKGNIVSTTNISSTDGLIPTNMNGPLTSDCQVKANASVSNALSYSANLEVYKQAASQSGLPWEVLAALHSVETGGSFNPKGSLVSGRIIGDIEPDIGKICITRASAKAKYAVPVETGCGFDSLLNSALYAAEHFKEKMSYAKNIARPGASDFELISAAFALYNGPGNSQCVGNTPKPETGGLYTGCGPKFLFEDHLYPFACFDERHAKMYVIYCEDGRKCSKPTLYGNIGAMTFIKAIQQKIASQKTSSSNEKKLTTPIPTIGANGVRPTQINSQPVVCNQSTGVDSRGNPCTSGNSSAQGMVDDIKSKCANGTVRASNANCVYSVSSLNDRAKNMIRDSAIRFDKWGGLQCVGYAFASALQLNGVDPQQYGNACDQAKDSNTYKFIPRSNGPPQVGDLIIWNSAGNVCNSDNVGHIAYISKVINANNIQIAEANWVAPGTVGTRNTSISNLTRGWLRKR